MSKVKGRPPTRAERWRGSQRRKARSARMKQLTAPVLWIAFALLVVGIITYFFVANMNIVNSAYPPVNSISCDQGEHTEFHIHAHLTMYINGKPSLLPPGVGIAPDLSCFYWLHTHDSSGVIHIEAPKGASFTLNDFLQIWSSHFQSLGFPKELDSSKGWKVYVDGKPYTGDFRSIPLRAHTLITLAYNSPNIKPDTTFNWGGL